MAPTLREGDVLEVDCGARELRPGDVVVFRPPGQGTWVVHRIVEVDRDWVRTRGDARMLEDDWLVEAGQVAGRVVAACQGPHRREIRGGQAGLAAARWVRTQGVAARWLRAGGRPLRRWLGVTRTMTGLAGQRARPRVVVFGECARLFWGNRVVGTFDPGRGWRLRRAFTWISDPRRLPVPNPRGSTDTSVPIANPVAVLREEPGRWAVLFNPDTAEAVALNPVGVAVWKMLEGGQTTSSIESFLQSEFRHVPPGVAGDIGAFVRVLFARGLIGYAVT